jgi:hypothetical protein
MKSYAFILDAPSLPNPFLVEVSRHTKTTWRHLAFYQPNVVKCSRAVAPILRCTLEDDLVFNEFRDLVKETILHCLLDDPLVSRQHAQEMVVASIVCRQAKRLLSTGGGAAAGVHNNQACIGSRTRGEQKRVELIMGKWRLVRELRLQEERHLWYPSLSDDIRRSFGELRHVLFCSHHVSKIL